MTRENFLALLELYQEEYNDSSLTVWNAVEWARVNKLLSDNELMTIGTILYHAQWSFNHHAYVWRAIDLMKTYKLN